MLAIPRDCSAWCCVDEATNRTPHDRSHTCRSGHRMDEDDMVVDEVGGKRTAAGGGEGDAKKARTSGAMVVSETPQSQLSTYVQVRSLVARAPSPHQAFQSCPDVLRALACSVAEWRKANFVTTRPYHAADWAQGENIFSLQLNRRTSSGPGTKHATPVYGFITVGALPFKCIRTALLIRLYLILVYRPQPTPSSSTPRVTHWPPGLSTRISVSQIMV